MMTIHAHLRDGRFLAGETFVDAPSEDAKAGWIMLENATTEELAWLGRKFRLHPLALEDCIHFDQRPKIEEYGDHLFLVVHGLNPSSEKLLQVFELHCFVTKDFIITVHEGDSTALRTLAERIKRDRAMLPESPDLILHKILDAVMDLNPTALESIEGHVERLDQEIFDESRPKTRRRSSRTIAEIHGVVSELNSIRHMLLPQKDILQALIRGEYPFVEERSRLYFRDVFDHLISLTRDVEELRERLWSIRDSQLAVAGYHANESMRRLTSFSVVFLPLTFITGFFGMNFEHIPWKSDVAFWATVAVVVALPIAMILWFVRKRWF